MCWRSPSDDLVALETRIPLRPQRFCSQRKGCGYSVKALGRVSAFLRSASLEDPSSEIELGHSILRF
jgi:hypothetical protein